ASDLAVFSARWALPDANFEKVTLPLGGPAPAFNSGWAEEIALDVEWAHAIAPGAKILLVEAASNGDADLYAAVDYAAARPDVSVISMSWGGTQGQADALNDFHFQRPGVWSFASAGDSGEEVEYPAASPYVTSVGGTTLRLV